MRLECGVIRASCTKTVELRDGEHAIRVRYEIVNRESRTIRFLFKQHLAIAIEEGQRIELPDGKVTPVETGFGSIARPGPTRWPYGEDARGNRLDISAVPAPSSNRREFVYVSELSEGWCGVRDNSTGARLRMSFQSKVFPFTWLFLTYGGWRDHFTAVLEPCTNMPKSLSAACAAGNCASLAAGATFRTEVRVDLA